MWELKNILVSGILLGLGITIPAFPFLATLSDNGVFPLHLEDLVFGIGVAIALSVGALSMMNRDEPHRHKADLSASLLLAGAIVSEHYTAYGSLAISRAAPMPFSHLLMILIVAGSYLLLHRLSSHDAPQVRKPHPTPGANTASLEATNQRLQREMAERAVMEDALRESQARLDGILNSLDDIVWSVSATDFQLLYLNPAAQKVYDRPLEDFFANSNLWLEVVHPDDLSLVKAGVQLLMAQGIRDIEYRILRPSGEVRWLRDRSRLVFDSTGQLIRIDGIATDITDSKRADQELQESEERFRKIFTEGPLGMALVGLDYRFIKVNSRLCQMLGYSEAEILERTFAEITHPDDLDGDIHLAQQLFIGEIPYYTLEKRYLKKNGDILWINLTGCVIRAEGAPLYFLAIIEDISDRTEYRAALEKERSLLRSIVANAPVAMAMFDTQMRYITHSDKWLADYQLVGQSIIGKSHYDIFPDLPEQWKVMHHRALAGEAVSHPEDIYIPDGLTPIYFRWAINPWYNPDGSVGGIVIVTDRIDELVRAREAALENARIKSQFLANISHEIRTPINGVLGMVGLLAHTQLSREQCDFVETLESSADSLLSIINDILDFSQLETGEIHLDNIEFNLVNSIENVLDLLAPSAQKKGLEIGSCISSDCPRKLSGDEGRLRQVLVNLVGNGIKFTSKGEVFIHAGLEFQTATHACIRFSVKDTGIGIGPENQEKLFKSFSQVDASMTRQYGGTGLGLAITKQLVELMGGQIGIDSTMGQGSTFWFTALFSLPAAPHHQSIPDSPAFPSPLSALKGKKILVVDDNATYRQTLCLQIQGWQMQVMAASSGAEAVTKLRLALLEGKPYDAAIVDMQMPEMDGATLVRLIQSDRQLQGTKLIMMTAVGTPSSEPSWQDEIALMATPSDLALASTGSSSYLIKPVKESTLQESLLEVLREKPAVPTPESLKAFRHWEKNGATTHTDVKILLVEDNVVNQKVVKNQLKRLGYGATVAGNGKEALEMLRAVDYDIVLMDCQMPVMDGYRATQEIRATEAIEKHHPIIIAMTAHAMKGDKEKCLAAGMDDYLSKPVDLDMLGKTLATWIERVGRGED
ncbi:MAG: hypothetical protein Fur0025_09890 [Oscillatoriaceae cyanobacterium]